MDNREAVSWLINILADIGKAEHSDLWHYEQALTEIKDMLEYTQVSQKGTTSDAIGRQAAIDVFDTDAELLRRALDNADIVGVERAKYEWGLNLIESYIADMKELPTAQPERKTGRWVSQKGGGYCCSECGRYALDEVDGNFIHVAFESNFCPYCGAKMERRTDGA